MAPFCQWRKLFLKNIKKSPSYTYIYISLFGASQQLRKDEHSIVMVGCVCPSLRMAQLGSHWTYFHEI